MNYNGYIKLYRKILDWEWFDNSYMVHLYLDLILNANIQDKSWHGEVIKRGQIMTSVSRLHEETNIPVSTIRRCLKKLENTGEITIETTNKFSLVTICNYDCYQANEQTSEQTDEQTSDKQATNKRQTDEQQLKNIKNIKKDKNDKKERNITSLDSDENVLLSFENIWNLYGKKGTKSTAKSRYEKLPQKTKRDILKYIPYYLSFTVPQYRKGFEVFISKEQWKNVLQDKFGNDIPFCDSEGNKLYHIANDDKFKDWFNEMVANTNIPKITVMTPDRKVNLNICYTLYKDKISLAMKTVLKDEKYIEMANSGMLSFDYIFNPVNLIKICEKGVNEN